MLFYKNNQWNICTEKVKYIQHGEEIEQNVGSEGKQWWIDFEEIWEHTEIIEFIDVLPTTEQLAKYEEILQLNLPEGFGAELSDYVEFGTFPKGFSHVLRPIEILKQHNQLEVDTSLSNMEIYNLLGQITLQNEVNQAEMQMEIIEMLSQLQGGN